MPFATKFRATMDLPFAGDEIGSFSVESVEVTDRPLGAGRYTYQVHMVLNGPGGKQGVRAALKPLFSSHPITFSGYGNPYQLWFARPEIESLGDKRYAVHIEGAGARVHLGDELGRFLDYLVQEDKLVNPSDLPGRTALLETYLQSYQREVRLQVGRYRSKLRRSSLASPGLASTVPAVEPVESQQQEVTEPEKVFPSSYRCPCGHMSHFAENTIREAKARSLQRIIRLGDSETDEHYILFHKGRMVDIICPYRANDNDPQG